MKLMDWKILLKNKKELVNIYNNKNYINEVMEKDQKWIAPMLEDNDGDDDYGRPIIRRFWMCPRCSVNIYYKYANYCSNCGQRLDYE